MSFTMASNTKLGATKGLRTIPLSYNNADSQTSALRLVLTLFPNWENDEGKIEFIRFTDGITNTVGFSEYLPAGTFLADMG